jgi:hypothetical protein
MEEILHQLIDGSQYNPNIYSDSYLSIVTNWCRISSIQSRQLLITNQWINNSGLSPNYKFLLRWAM